MSREECEVGSKTYLYRTLIRPSVMLHETCQWPDYREPRFEMCYEHQ